jgi:hypothetical protein
VRTFEVGDVVAIGDMADATSRMSECGVLGPAVEHCTRSHYAAEHRAATLS